MRVSPGSPSQIRAALLRRHVARCRSRQLYEMLILPPTNHCACGSSHFKTVSHFLNQCSSLSAIRAQNRSGSALAFARSASSPSIDLMWAFSANVFGGWKTRSSRWTDSMLVVVDDMVFLSADITGSPAGQPRWGVMLSAVRSEERRVGKGGGGV